MATLSPISSYSCPSPPPVEDPTSAPVGVNFGRNLQTAISTSTKMTVTSRAVTMAVMADVKTSEVVGQWVVGVAAVGDTVLVLVVAAVIGNRSLC